ncbi:MAG: hemolysin family protein [Pyrinomonadaceae bacterium]|nr:hemolysin family protein [Pyrinomonadaceae bacterium]
MSVIVFEVLLIILLVFANGIFAMSEMAIVSARKARLQQLVNSGDAKARAALKLANAPDRFLSTVQIGITLVGILAGAFGGATIAEQIADYTSRFPTLAPYGEAIGLGVVVLSITYLSLIFGELVPKRFALNNPERIASLVAQPMNLLSKLAAPFVSFLALSSNVVFKILRVKPSSEPTVTEEEIKILIEQGTQAGVFEETEQDMVESVFRLADRRIGALMTPRLDIEWLDSNASPDEIRQKMAKSHYSRFPVGEESLDNVIGVVKAKDYLALQSETASLQAVLKQPLFVPETQTALQTLKLFKRSHTHIALIIDEHGAVEGLVTTNDVLEAIVGDIALPAGQAEAYAVRREDGSWLLDGALPIDEFKDLFAVAKLAGEEKGAYQTLAGFILMYLGRVPAAADHFEWNGLRFEIMDMDGNRVDKVLVAPVK